MAVMDFSDDRRPIRLVLLRACDLCEGYEDDGFLNKHLLYHESFSLILHYTLNNSASGTFVIILVAKRGVLSNNRYIIRKCTSLKGSSEVPPRTVFSNQTMNHFLLGSM